MTSLLDGHPPPALSNLWRNVGNGTRHPPLDLLVAAQELVHRGPLRLSHLPVPLLQSALRFVLRRCQHSLHGLTLLETINFRKIANVEGRVGRGTTARRGLGRGGIKLILLSAHIQVEENDKKQRSSIGPTREDGLRQLLLRVLPFNI